MDKDLDQMPLRERVRQPKFWWMLLLCMGIVIPLMAALMVAKEMAGKWLDGQKTALEQSPRTFQITPQGLVDKYNEKLKAVDDKGVRQALQLPSVDKMGRAGVVGNKSYVLIQTVRTASTASDDVSVRTEIVVDSASDHPMEFYITWTRPVHGVLQAANILIAQGLLSRVAFSGEDAGKAVVHLCIAALKEGDEDETEHSDVFRTQQIDGITLFCERQNRIWYAGIRA